MQSSALRRLRGFLSLRRPANRTEVAAVRESSDRLGAQVEALARDVAERSDRAIDLTSRLHAESSELGRLRHKHSWDAAQARHETVLESGQERHLTLLDRLGGTEGLIRELHADALHVAEQQHHSLHDVGQARHETSLEMLSSRFELLDQLVRGVHNDDWEASQQRHRDLLEALEAMQSANARILQRLVSLQSADPLPRGRTVTADAPTGLASEDADDRLDPATGRAVLVSASNDNFLPLAKGLWTSILRAGLDADFELAWIDIGNSDETRAWLSRAAPMVRHVDLAVTVTEFITRLSSQNYHSALLLRPFLPDMFPEATEIVWIDSDIWVQEARAVRDFARVVRDDPKATAIVPILDVAYRPLFERAGAFVEDNVKSVWRALYGDAVARELGDRPLLSAGIFAMHPNNPIWTQWKSEIERHWTAKDTVPAEFMHVAEQTAFNFLQYRSGAFAPLDALHNFHANLGRLRRGVDGVVRTDEAVPRPVGVIHLSDIVTRRLAQDYVAGELLFDSGASLSAEEIERVIALARC